MERLSGLSRDNPCSAEPVAQANLDGPSSAAALDEVDEEAELACPEAEEGVVEGRSTRSEIVQCNLHPSANNVPSRHGRSHRRAWYRDGQRPDRGQAPPSRTGPRSPAAPTGRPASLVTQLICPVCWRTMQDAQEQPWPPGAGRSADIVLRWRLMLMTVGPRGHRRVSQPSSLPPPSPSEKRGEGGEDREDGGQQPKDDEVALVREDGSAHDPDGYPDDDRDGYPGDGRRD